MASSENRGVAADYERYCETVRAKGGIPVPRGELERRAKRTALSPSHYLQRLIRILERLR